ncbi:MAG: hypothetical protein H6Q57_2008, partial [Geobacteraceae bacterium]|nr:hypothetical protein [Geobacteraceae bacterium]
MMDNVVGKKSHRKQDQHPGKDRKQEKSIACMSLDADQG